MGVEDVVGEAAAAEAAGRLVDGASILVEAAVAGDAGGALLVRLAQILDRLGHASVAMELSAAATARAPADLDLLDFRVGALSGLGRYREALDVIARADVVGLDGPVSARLRRRVYLAAGMTALAAEEPGPRALGLWWRTGGPRRWVRRRRRAGEWERLRQWDADAAAPAEAPAELPLVLARMRNLLDRDRRVELILTQAQQLEADGWYAAAEALLRDALGADADSPALLAALARNERYQGHDGSALTHFRAAVAIEPADQGLLLDQAHVLLHLGRYRDIIALLSPPPAGTYEPVFRDVLAQAYQRMGLPTYAVQACGGRRSLRRWRLWWSSGGPLWPVRRWRRRVDRSVLDSWRGWSGELWVLDELDWPVGFDPAETRDRLDSYLQRYASRIMWWRAVSNVAHAGVLTVMAVLAFGGLAAVTHLRVGLAPWSAALVAAGGVVAAGGLFRFVFFRLTRAPDFLGMLTRCVPAGVALLAAGGLLAGLGRWTGSWSYFAAGVLVAAAVTAACYAALVGSVQVILGLRIRTLRRYSPREDAVESLVEILDEVRHVEHRNDLDHRASWTWLLEHAATAIQTQLARQLGPYDSSTAAWAAERAGGAATALRQLKRHIAAPAVGSWDRLTAELGRAVVALATGDFGTLRWSPPPAPTTTRRSRRATALAIAKTIAVTAFPLLAVLAVQPLLQLDPDALRWGKLAGLIWAVLYLLLTLDDTLRDKIDTTRALLDTARGTGTGRDRSGP